MHVERFGDQLTTKVASDDVETLNDVRTQVKIPADLNSSVGYSVILFTFDCLYYTPRINLNR